MSADYVGWKVNVDYQVNLVFSREDQLWVAYYPELRGCMGAGDTREQALRIGEEMKNLWLETCWEKNRPVPPPVDAPEKYWPRGEI